MVSVRMIFLNSANFGEDINDQNFSEHMNTLVREGKVIRKIYSKNLIHLYRQMGAVIS